MPIEEIKEKKF